MKTNKTSHSKKTTFNTQNDYDLDQDIDDESVSIDSRIDNLPEEEQTRAIY